MSTRQYFLGLLFLTFILTLLVVNYFDSNDFLYYAFKRNLFDYVHTDNETFNNYTRKECNPFIKISKQFSIRLNNQTYPQSVPLSRNNSINYECLNQNKKLKVILLWNTFFGDVQFAFGLGKKELFVRQR